MPLFTSIAKGCCYDFFFFGWHLVQVVKDAVDLNLKPEKQKADKIGSDDEKNEKKDSERESDDFGNLKNLKKEFDNLDTDTSQKDETMMQDASPADDDKKDKLKGSVDDA